MIKQAQDLLTLSEYVNNLYTNNNNLTTVNENLKSENESLREENERLRVNQMTERDKKIEDVISRGIGYMDLPVPYKFGGKYYKNQAFDCSSFVQACYYRWLGVESDRNPTGMPRVSRDQARYGTEVFEDDIQRGDLLFFDTDGDNIINHVGIYLGDGKMLHTAVEGENITIDDWKKRYKRLITARRVI